MTYFALTLLLVVSVIFIEANVTGRIPVLFPKKEGEIIKNAILKCTKDDPDQVGLLKLVQNGSYREDEDFKKMLYCAYRDSGYSYKNGTVDARLCSALFPLDSERMYKLMLDCVDNTTGETPVDVTYNYFTCYQDSTPYLIKLV